MKITQCILCLSKEERSEAEFVLCGECVQKLLQATDEEKIKLRDKLLEKDRPEAAKMVESFIVGEQDGELHRLPGERRDRKFNTGKRPMRTTNYQKRHARSPKTKQRVPLPQHISTSSNLS